MEIKLEAKNPSEVRILKYLQENASEVLAGKINSGSKTISGAMKHCKSEAQKLAQGEGSAYVEDETVFGWVIHYFEEDSIKESAPAVRMPAGVKTRPSVPVAPTKKADPQLDMFTMVGGVQSKPEPVIEEEPETEEEPEDKDNETTPEDGSEDPF